MKITKTAAQEAATKMLKSKQDEVKNLEIELSNLLVEKIRANTTKVILEAFDNAQTKDFVKSINRVALIGEGFNRVIFYTLTPFPCESYSKTLINEKGSLEKARKLFEKIETKRLKIKEAKTKIENTILSLRTYDKVSKVYPEAYLSLPQIEQKRGIEIVNIDNLKKEIQEI